MTATNPDFPPLPANHVEQSWIDNLLGEPPYPGGTLVDVQYRDGQVELGIRTGLLFHNGETDHQPIRSAENWSLDGSRGDIVSFCLHAPQWRINTGVCPYAEGTRIDVVYMDSHVEYNIPALEPANANQRLAISWRIDTHRGTEIAYSRLHQPLLMDDGANQQIAPADAEPAEDPSAVWIVNPGFCPVSPGHTRIRIQLRNGDLNVGPAEDFNWCTDFDSPADILQFQVLLPERQATPEPIGPGPSPEFLRDLYETNQQLLVYNDSLAQKKAFATAVLQACRLFFTQDEAGVRAMALLAQVNHALDYLNTPVTQPLVQIDMAEAEARIRGAFAEYIVDDRAVTDRLTRLEAVDALDTEHVRSAFDEFMAEAIRREEENEL